MRRAQARQRSSTPQCRPSPSARRRRRRRTAASSGSSAESRPQQRGVLDRRAPPRAAPPSPAPPPPHGRACRGSSRWPSPGCARSCAVAQRAPRRRREPLRPGSSSVDARISARWTVRTPVRRARQPAADVHQARVVHRAHHLGAACRARRGPCRTASPSTRPRSSPRTSRRSRSTRAASGSSTSSIPRTADSSRSGRSPTPRLAQRVAGRVVRDPVRVVRAHVLDAEHVHEELGQLVARAGARPRQVARAPCPAQDADGVTTASAPRTPAAKRRASASPSSA